MLRAKGKPVNSGIARVPRWKLIAVLFLLLCGVLGAKAWNDTMGPPHVLRTSIAVPGLSDGSAPVTIALISDIHVAGPDMPPERLERIVAKINGLKPDLVAIAGDLVSAKRTATRIYTPSEIVAPLAQLNAPLGTIVVPGNHDHWFDWDELKIELNKAGVLVLENSAAKIGPLAVGGLDDEYTGRDDLDATLAGMDTLNGVRMIISHSPDPFAEIPTTVPLMLAGHTHCGQIAFPWGGAPAYMSRYGDRYACGRVDEDRKTLIVGAGLGTSLIPLRFFTQPEIWLIELAPAKHSAE